MRVVRIFKNLAKVCLRLERWTPAVGQGADLEHFHGAVERERDDLADAYRGGWLGNAATIETDGEIVEQALHRAACFREPDTREEQVEPHLRRCLRRRLGAASRSGGWSLPSASAKAFGGRFFWRRGLGA